MYVYILTCIQVVRQDFTEVEAEYTERRAQFEKLTVGLEMEKVALERDCDEAQVRGSGALCMYSCIACILLFYTEYVWLCRICI